MKRLASIAALSLVVTLGGTAASVVPAFATDDAIEIVPATEPVEAPAETLEAPDGSEAATYPAGNDDEWVEIPLPPTDTTRPQPWPPTITDPPSEIVPPGQDPATIQPPPGFDDGFRGPRHGGNNNRPIVVPNWDCNGAQASLCKTWKWDYNWNYNWDCNGKDKARCASWNWDWDCDGKDRGRCAAWNKEWNKDCNKSDKSKCNIEVTIEWNHDKDCDGKKHDKCKKWDPRDCDGKKCNVNKHQHFDWKADKPTKIPATGQEGSVLPAISVLSMISIAGAALARRVKR